MRLFTHFTRAKKGETVRNDFEDFLSKNPKDNLENMIKEGVLYGRTYQSFFCNKDGFREYLPYMISVTENRFHDNSIFLNHNYSYGLIFTPGFIESTSAKPIIYQSPEILNEIMFKKSKLSKEEIKEWTLEKGYLFNISTFKKKEFSQEKEYRIKLSLELDCIHPKKGVGLYLSKDDVMMLIVPESDVDYFETVHNLPAVPQEKIIYLANARKNTDSSIIHDFPSDDIFLFNYANNFLERTGANYRWKIENNTPVKFFS